MGDQKVSLNNHPETLAQILGQAAYRMAREHAGGKLAIKLGK